MNQAKKALLLAAALTMLTPLAHARDTTLHIPLADVLDMPEAKEKLDGSVRFFLAGQATPKVLKRFAIDSSNTKTNGVGKSDEFGCKWTALTALINLQKTAKQHGANAVIDMVSYYKKKQTKSSTTFECHAGAVVIGVALKGTYAKIAK